jgi:hypothetical protein
MPTGPTSIMCRSCAHRAQTPVPNYLGPSVDKGTTVTAPGTAVGVAPDGTTAVKAPLTTVINTADAVRRGMEGCAR